jgi:hypothetical protein
MSGLCSGPQIAIRAAIGGAAVLDFNFQNFSSTGS